MFQERLGDHAPAQIANRRDLARHGIGATRAGIKFAAEAAWCLRREQRRAN